MEVTARMTTTAAPTELFAWVDDLGRYPDWLDIVPRAESVDPTDDGRPVWSVDLRGRVGPLARSKRLRMARVEHRPPERVVFERREVDGRDHATWRMTVDVAETDEGSSLDMNLFYDGRFGGRPLELLLEREIGRSRARLRGLVEDG